MASQHTKAGSPAPKSDSNALKVTSSGDKSSAAQMAQAVLNGLSTNGVTARTFASGLFGDLDVTECVTALTDSARRVNGGDLRQVENILVAQAVNLDAIFNELARRAAINMGTHLDATERYMRLALKAQGQCRSTLETLATIKNPPTVFARQANITSGPQQVNNGAFATSTRTGARAGKNDSLKNELLEDHQHDNMDTRATGAASRPDSDLATVGALHGAANTQG